MAKKTKVLVKLENPNTGTYYVVKKDPRKQTEKMEFKKYDKKTRKHEVFKETKLKS